ncbi:MAG: hypothetical protein VX822_02005 [Candidatus Neomarinimicrobiota bacterium]|nr:hypothetical protein [Candidatus Neomarinimicrobiota bacterium]
MDLANLKELEQYFADNFDTMLFPVLSEHYLVTGDLERSERVCDIGLLHNSDSLAGQFLRARVLMAKKNFVEAEQCLKKVLGLDPAFLNARILLVEVQSALKQSKHSLKQSYLDILELDPGNRQATKALASLTRRPKSTAVGKEKKATAIKTRSKKQGVAPGKSKSNKKTNGTTKPARKTQTQSRKKAKASSQANPPKKQSEPAKRSPKKKPRTAKKPAQKKRKVSPKPATFTLLKVLKNQKLYEEALEVLAVMSEKRGTDKSRISKEIKSIKALLKSSEGT